MRNKLTCFILLLCSLLAQPALDLRARNTQDEPVHYRAYKADGAPASLEEIVSALVSADVLIIGETHDDAVAHRLEAELFEMVARSYGAGSHGTKRTVALSLEMFDSDVQTVVDEYLGGLIIERHFLASSRPWRNYPTDYRPLVERARSIRAPVIAANAPARYVTRVSMNGPNALTALSEDARRWLPPLPYPAASEAYAAKFRRFMQGESERAPAPTPQAATPQTATPERQKQEAVPTPHSAHGGAVYLLDAQTLRDASMAYRITEFLKRNPGALVVHVNGTFHSEGRLGVPEQIEHYRRGTRTLIVTIVRGEGFSRFDAPRHKGLGDFIILTDPAAQTSNASDSRP